MQQYLDLLKHILENGEESDDRTGVGTIKTFGNMLKFYMSDGSFPIITTKKVNYKGIVAELLWFISGSRDVKDLQKYGVHIWDANANSDYWLKNLNRKFDGDVGRIYGTQWRSWLAPCKMCNGIHTNKFDQLQNVIEQIKTNPNSRRLVVSAWNPSDFDEQSLPCCHILYQFQVSKKGLSLIWFQRSVDTYLGLTWNISSYATLLCMVSKLTGYKPHELVCSLADTHIYLSHLDQVKLQLTRTPYKLPKLFIADRKQRTVDDFVLDDFSLEGYKSWSAIKAEMAV